MYLNSLSVCAFILCVFLCMANPIVDHGNYIRTKSNNLIENVNNGVDAIPTSKVYGKGSPVKHNRFKRQFEFAVDADYEDDLGTDLMATAHPNVYKTEKTRVDATARYPKHLNSYGDHGKAKFGGSLSVAHNV